MSEQFPEDLQFCYEERSSTTIRTQCSAYAKAYHDRMGNMVEDRMCAAVKALGDIWLTAWIDAGQPDLPFINVSTLDKNEEKAQKQLQRAVQERRIKGREHD